MESELNPTKKRFDLSMSRRTRKPLNNLFKETHQDISITSSPPKEPPHHHHQSNQQQDQEQEQEQEREREQKQEQDREREQKQEQEKEQEIDHRSLNQLMRGEEEPSGEGGNSKSSLGEHFSEEEKQMKMQIVSKTNDKQSGDQNGVKFRGIMGRYVKVLSGLIKAKHDSRRLSTSKKKPIFRVKF